MAHMGGLQPGPKSLGKAGLCDPESEGVDPGLLPGTLGAPCKKLKLRYKS